VGLLWLWASSGYPTTGEICEVSDGAKHCESYNIFFSSAWNAAEAVAHWSELIIAFFTVVLAVATIGLFVSSRALWNATERTAKIAERALTELEAPVVEVKILEPGIIRGPTGSLETSRLSFCFANYGRTPAHILEILDEITSIPVGETLAPFDPN